MAAGLHDSLLPMVPTILAVDDHLDLLATYYRLLSLGGYRVVTAPTRATGLAALERERPKLVISDVRLQDGDGLDVIRAARALVPPAATIVVTGFGSEAYREAARAAGAFEFLLKPFQTVTLIDLVRMHAPVLPSSGGFR